MKALLPALLTMFGLDAKPAENDAPPVPVTEQAIDPAARAYGPRGTHPRRRSYGLPPGDWSTPNRRVLDRHEAPAARAAKEARRAKAWASTCAARGYA